MSSLYHEDHPDDERFDSVTIDCIERWKESELSGDEYRFSYRVRFWRKEIVIIERSFSTLEYAIKYLPSMPSSTEDSAVNHDGWNATKRLCDQPGCALEASVFYKRKKHFTPRGEELVMGSIATYRQFCVEHKHRGDCSRDDSDHNYEAIENPSK